MTAYLQTDEKAKAGAVITETRTASTVRAATSTDATLIVETGCDERACGATEKAE
jgi:hypothetical protein